VVETTERQRFIQEVLDGVSGNKLILVGYMYQTNDQDLSNFACELEREGMKPGFESFVYCDVPTAQEETLERWLESDEHGWRRAELFLRNLRAASEEQVQTLLDLCHKHGPDRPIPAQPDQ